MFVNVPEDKVSEKNETNLPQDPPKPVLQQETSVSTGDYAPVGLCLLAIIGSLAGFKATRRHRK